MYKVIGPIAKHGECNEQMKKKKKIEEPGEEYFTDLLKDYFLMDIKLDDISSHWCKAGKCLIFQKWLFCGISDISFISTDENISKLFKDFKGVRVLRQDPIETLFAFICSSNNNINRITSMVENLCKHFGEQLAEVFFNFCLLRRIITHLWFKNQIGDDAYFAFPTIERLSENSTLGILKDLRFGYRAKFICEAAKFLMNNFEEGYLHNLRLKPYLEAKKELIKIPGVGAKVCFYRFCTHSYWNLLMGWCHNELSCQWLY